MKNDGVSLLIDSATLFVNVRASQIKFNVFSCVTSENNSEGGIISLFVSKYVPSYPEYYLNVIMTFILLS